MSKRKSFFTTCRDCGKTYHYSTDTCPHCGLIPYWLRMAEYYRKEAARCEAIAKSLQEEKDREAEKEADREAEREELWQPGDEPYEPDYWGAHYE